MEKRCLRKDGEIVWVLLSVSVSKDSDGTPEFFISQMQDITARKRAEAALQRTLAQKESLLNELEESTAALRNLRKEFVTVCAWTQRVQRDGEWMNLTRFLAEHLQLSLSHTVSDEAADQFLDGVAPRKG